MKAHGLPLAGYGLLGLLALAAPAAAQPAETTTSAVAWSREAWGEIGIAHMKNAPYPDDSRTSGFQTDHESFPYEGHYDDNRAAFAIPRDFLPTQRVDFVVICHGHRNQCQRFLKETNLGPLLDASGRNAILIVPQGPREAPDSGGGKFEKPQGFAAFMNEALEVLRKEGKIPEGAQIGNIVLGGFSGGYRPVACVLDRGGMNDKISEVWLVDAAYGFHEELAAPFVEPASPRTLRSIFTDHLATETVRIMSLVGKKGVRVAVAEDDLLSTSAVSSPQAAPNELSALLRRERLLFTHTNLPHDAFKLSQRFLGDFLRESPSLKPRPGVQ